MDKLATYLAAERERLRGDHEKALALYRKVAELDPDDWKTSESIAGELEALGQKRDAIRELFQAAHRLIWRTCYEDARRLLERILRMDPAQELFVTRGVRSRLDEIAQKIGEAAPAAAATPSAQEMEIEHEPGFEETRSALEALVIDESTGGFRVPDDILSLIDRAPVARPPSRRLALRVLDDVLRMDGRELLIGCGDSCNLVLRQPGVLEHHARIVEMDGHYLLSSEQPGARIVRNGEPADGIELEAGDVLAFGDGGADVLVELV